MLHGYTTVGEGITSSLSSMVQNRSQCCNFTNDTAIFIRGLKNVHSLPTRIYEHNSQRLKDTITKVEKLSAAQQLTATILPSSTVNMMSNEDNWCFQCQEPGHITWHCPCIRCHECEECRHIVMDCPNKILPSDTPAQHHRVHRNHNIRSSSRHHQEDWEIGPDHSLDIADIKALAIMACTEAATDCNKGMVTLPISYLKKSS